MLSRDFAESSAVACGCLPSRDAVTPAHAAESLHTGGQASMFIVRISTWQT
jgi:hypothetical protein